MAIVLKYVSQRRSPIGWPQNPSVLNPVTTFALNVNGVIPA